ncbi:MAG: hypothetical protein A2Y57_01300 [Candidatus Woykebacteria bacterium RBG_13_40_7b]|uniref:Histidine kinase N-terminal 7TM region domain-containing protein n=1 Tax=Candidatus Woykebacteria bacterium RBG_13_40_7b TaxID=1802594 RepID=A0A1G1WA01_9BACT|nr:MAG: hypothetical protein A2Y57_01300 [Candidatus Woykebacteria bacterium RBG_13_40_7b]
MLAARLCWRGPPMTKDNLFKIIISLFVILIIWWIILQILPDKETTAHSLYNFGYGLIFLLAGILGLNKASFFKKDENKIGLSLIFLSFASFSYFAAQTIWTFYNLVLQNEKPYPSFADIFYVAFYALVGIGLFLIILEAEKLFDLTDLIFIFFVPTLAIILSFYIYTQLGYFSNPDKTFIKPFFDILYTFGDVILISLSFAVIHWWQNLRKAFLILASSFLIAALADFLFSLTISNNTYYNGNFVDLFFTISGFAFAWGISLIKPKET